MNIDKENESPTLKDGDCRYTLDGNNGEATLTGLDHEVSGAYEIPRTLGGCRVTGIAERVFMLHSGLTSVTIPESVTRIGEGTFNNCDELTEIHVEEGNPRYRSIDGVLFDKARTRIVQVPTGIRGKIRIPGSVVTVCGFSFCTDLTEVVIENGVTGIATGAFIHCVRLASVTIPDSVASIESYAFAGCRRLAGIILPDRVTRIERNLFSGCHHLVKVVCGQNVTEIGDNAFSDCGSLAALTVPQSVSRIGKSAFYGCSSLKDIEIPRGVTEIASYTFSHCASIEAVTIPMGVITIQSSAFADCASLTEVSIPDSVTCVGKRAFSDCVKLSHVTLPKSIRRIEDGAFSNCSSLSEIEIPSGVTRLSSFTFIGCTSLLRIGLPASLTRIGFYVFFGNRALTAIDVAEGNPLYRSVKGVLFDKKLARLVRCPEGFSDSLFIPASVARLSLWCCEGCTRLTEINVAEANPRYSSRDGILYNKKQTTLLMCPGGKTGRVVIPAHVSLMAQYAFEGCAGVTELVVDRANGHYRSVDGIVYDRQMTTVVRCPEGKKGLEIIPATVTCRADGSHRRCRGLSAVEVDDANPCFSSLDGVLYDKGFTKLIGCPDAKCGAVDIPASVARVSNQAFSNCEGLTEIRVDAANPFFSSEDGILFNKDRSLLICCPWDKEGVARIPKSVMGFEDNAFLGCARLTAFDVAADNPVYSSRDGLLLNKKMTEVMLCPKGKKGQVRIPASVEFINDEAFKGCDKLECVIIPEEAIGMWCDSPSYWFGGEIRYEK